MLIATMVIYEGQIWLFFYFITSTANACTSRTLSNHKL